ncbi:hypothetical protein EVJ58_g537 [Rhodofomes roseus]|uniref:WH1 domain-containing protein n=1 Tax=Rhodofomes roseus TaxID=34475 RepID=A0A4Y9Z5D0_9APHY|nr:hypothetical protein EVJ58_g537 [Rhodofomes roseus]
MYARSARNKNLKLQNVLIARDLRVRCGTAYTPSSSESHHHHPRGMPAQSTLSSDEKSKVKAAVPAGSNKIHTAALARIYYAYPQPNEWSYAGLQGALAFVTDKSRNALYMKMVDLAGTRGIIWEHELYDGFEYYQDRPFFQSFPGDDCMIGIVFADEGEAKTFYKKVTTTKPSTGTSNSCPLSVRRSTSVYRRRCPAAKLDIASDVLR